MKGTYVLTVVLCAGVLAGPLTAQTLQLEWPQWRGPDRTACSTEGGLLKSWPEGGPPHVWTVTGLGDGFSSVAVSDGRIFTMGNTADGQVLTALDFATGRKLWTGLVNVRPYTNKRGDGPRGTPTVDDGRVYTEGGYGTVCCWDARTGKRLWRVSLPDDLNGTQPGWGYSESPLVSGSALIVTPGGVDGAVAALDRKTGRVLWRSKDCTYEASYCSPVPATLDGKPQIVQGLDKRLVGVDALTGKLLWEFREPVSGAFACTPVVHEGLVFGSTGYGAGSGVARVTRDGAQTVWHDKKAGNHHGGVVRVGDYVYGFLGEKNTLHCVELESGRVAWQDASVGKGSMVYADGHLTCLGEGAHVALVEATPDGYTEKGRFRLPRGGKGPSWAHPVVVHGRLFVRHGDVLHCWDVKAK